MSWFVPLIAFEGECEGERFFVTLIAFEGECEFEAERERLG